MGNSKAAKADRAQQRQWQYSCHVCWQQGNRWREKSGKTAGEQKPSAFSCVCAAVSKKFKNINGNYHKIETTELAHTPRTGSHIHTHTRTGIPSHRAAVVVVVVVAAVPQSSRTIFWLTFLTFWGEISFYVYYLSHYMAWQMNLLREFA